jgi:tellurite resistance protein
MAFGYDSGLRLRAYIGDLGYAFEDDWFAGDTLTAMVECGVLMAASDLTLDEDEIQEIADFMYGFTGGLITAGDTIALINGCLEALEADGFEGRIGAVATYVPGYDAARLGLSVAACVALSDGELDESELDMYYTLGDALGISRGEAEVIFTQMEAAIDDTWW